MALLLADAKSQLLKRIEDDRDNCQYMMESQVWAHEKRQRQSEVQLAMVLTICLVTFWQQ